MSNCLEYYASHLALIRAIALSDLLRLEILLARGQPQWESTDLESMVTGQPKVPRRRSNHQSTAILKLSFRAKICYVENSWKGLINQDSK